MYLRCSDCPHQGRKVCSSHRGTTKSPGIAFIAGSPDSRDIAKGEPFSGSQGEILRTTMVALGMSPEKHYYDVAVRCQMPRGKEPRKTEISACSETLALRLASAQPRLIMPMGNAGVTAILGTGRGITHRRGRYSTVEIGDLTYGVLPTVDPGSVNRNPEAFPDLLTDLTLAKRILDGAAPRVDPPYDRYYLADTEDKVAKALHRLRSDCPEWIAVDIETTSLDPRDGEIICVGLSWKRDSAVVLDWQALHYVQELTHTEDGWQTLTGVQILERALANSQVSYHHGQFDARWLHARGLDVNFDFDTMLAHHLLDERPGSHGLERLAIDRYQAPSYEEELKQEHSLPGSGAVEGEQSYAAVPREQLMRYNAADVDYTYRLTQDFMKELPEDLYRLNHSLVIPAARYFTNLEHQGVPVDRDHLESLGAAWGAEIADIDARIASYPGAEDLNLNSPKQLAAFLYDHLGLEPMPSTEGEEFIDSAVVQEMTGEIEDPDALEYFRTASSAVFTKLKPRSTAAYMLWYLADQHEFPKLLVQRKTIDTRYRNYYVGIRDRLDDDGYLHPHYRLHGTRTGRLSASNPNVHGMIRSSEIRRIYNADPGYVLLDFDYSQAEIRMVAHLAQDEVLTETLRGEDIHSGIAQRLFSMTTEEWEAQDSDTRKLRRRAAKTIAFGLIYGRGAKSLAPQIGVTPEEAEQYMLAFFEQMPGVRRWIERQKATVRASQEVRSLFGRRRRFPILTKGGLGHAERQGVNMPVQSSVSDMTLMAQLKMVRTMQAKGIEVRPHFSIHDGGLLRVPEDRVDEAVRIAKDALADVPFETDVPFTSDVAVGPSWGETKEV